MVCEFLLMIERCSDKSYSANIYEIYSQPDAEHRDMDKFMKEWPQVLRGLYGLRSGEDLRPDDYIFPAVNANATLERGKPMTQTYFQQMMDEFLLAAGILNGSINLTLHSFRRGGAQHWFIYAPIGQRWCLTRCQWWGGWDPSAGENVCHSFRCFFD